MARVKDAKLVAVYGRRGSGKSTMVKRMIRDHRRVVVFDPQAEYGEEMGWPSVDKLPALVDIVAKQWRSKKGVRVAYVPAPNREAEQLHHVARLCWQLQRPYLAGADDQKLLLVIEEASLGYPSKQLPAQLDGMPRLVNQGRHAGIEAVAICQRPTELSPTLRGQVGEFYCFPLSYQDDRDLILKGIGRQHADAFTALPVHHYVAWRNGAVAWEKNPPIRK